MGEPDEGGGVDRVATTFAAESVGTAPGRGRLVGRRLLVVGAGQDSHALPDPPIGNGRAISILCAREGAAVAAADRDRESVARTVEAITEQGGRATALVADVAVPDEIEEMVSASRAALGGLDGVVYNVGIGAGAGLEQATAAAWDHVLTVNLRGAMLTTRAVVPVLEDGGSIVLVSSVAAIKPGSRIPAYDASKAALGGLMRHVALEGERRRIRVNVVAPGLMDTALGRMASAGRPSRARTPVPLGRQGTAWETAYAVLFLLSHEAAYITGHTLVVDGGLTALR
ncbi:MAG: SDR family oxidoreductase [Actinomycetota bacterium]|nr:SDR family oxidoreductase [Actinomycetota bacterium]